jgi:hypothetical protein
LAKLYPTIENINRLKVPPTKGELDLVSYLEQNLDDSYEVFFNPYLDGDRPDIIIMKEGYCVFVIEVKDWDLSLYSINETNSWSVISDSGRAKIKKSPQSQAFGYKKNLYDLHLPVVGIARLTNPNFFNLVNCFVYFHVGDEEQLNSLYAGADKGNILAREKVVQDFKDGKLQHEKYERQNDFLLSKKRQIQRDKSMSFCRDTLHRLAVKIRKESNHILFDEKIYRDFKRRLSPPENTLKQGIKLKLDNKQQRLVNSNSGKEKLKGVAGCGKTTVMAHRAINAHERHDSTVLILTFNITLKNYIRDKLSDIRGGRNFNGFEISNYHQFFNSQLNNTEQDIAELVDQYGIDNLYEMDLFADQDNLKYQTILLDEVQDYKPQWVKIIRDNFLSDEGEMVLFGDESQDIYARDSGRSAVIAQGFGRWNKLNRSYRTSYDSPLNRLFKDFQLRFLVDKYSDTDVIDTAAEQFGLGYSLLKYEPLPQNDYLEAAFDSITAIITAYALHPNDIIIVCSKIYPLRRLNELLSVNNESTHCMFETYKELGVLLGKTELELKGMSEKALTRLVHAEKSEIDRVRRIKKNHFYANSGNIKISTTHSYKGLESKSVFYLMLEDDEPELVYTSITRSTENLMVLDVGSGNPSSNFFAGFIK